MSGGGRETRWGEREREREREIVSSGERKRVAALLSGWNNREKLALLLKKLGACYLAGISSINCAASPSRGLFLRVQPQRPRRRLTLPGSWPRCKPINNFAFTVILSGDSHPLSRDTLWKLLRRKWSNEYPRGVYTYIYVRVLPESPRN